MGRIIVVAAFVAIGILTAAFPPAILAVYAAAIFVVPWLIVRAARFQARNTSWSNVRFDFKGTYGDAFVTFILMPIGVTLTLQLTLPFLTRRANRFFVGGHRLGDRAFDMKAPISSIYLAFLASIGFAMVALLILGVAVGGTVASQLAAFDPTDPASANALQIVPILVYFALIFAFLPAAVIYRAMVRNTIYAHTVLEGGHRFISSVRPLRMLALVVTNVIVVVCTLGLALPWAQIRLARFMAYNTAVVPIGSLDAFAGKVQADQSAIGDAFADLEGFDIGAAAI